MAVDNNPVGLAEFVDCLGLKTPGHVDLPEAAVIKHIQDIADMAGITGCIQCLNAAHRLGGRKNRGPVNQGTALVTFAQRVKLAAAEGANFIYQAGAVCVLKRAGRLSPFFLILLVACYPADQLGPYRTRRAPDRLPDNPSLYSCNIHIAHGGAAMRATQAANCIDPVMTDFVFETIINTVKFIFQLNEVHGLNEDTKIVMEIKSVLDFSCLE